MCSNRRCNSRRWSRPSLASRSVGVAGAGAAAAAGAGAAGVSSARAGSPTTPRGSPGPPPTPAWNSTCVALSCNSPIKRFMIDPSRVTSGATLPCRPREPGGAPRPVPGDLGWIRLSEVTLTCPDDLSPPQPNPCQAGRGRPQPQVSRRAERSVRKVALRRNSTIPRIPEGRMTKMSCHNFPTVIGPSIEVVSSEIPAFKKVARNSSRPSLPVLPERFARVPDC